MKVEYKFKLVSSLEKIFFKGMEKLQEQTSGSMLQNEIYSFQLVGWCSNEENQRVVCHYEVHSELAPYITVKAVGYVPNLVPCIEVGDDDGYITKTPGLFPDPLLANQDHCFVLSNLQTRALWFSVEPDGQLSGTYPITILLYDDNLQIIDELTYKIHIVDARLPELPIPNTCWLYGDCIAKLHNVEVMSEEYLSIMEKFLEVYTRFGHNMILTPIITPPLNTAVGAERPTNQLVDIFQDKGIYRFEFTKLAGWIHLCKKYGIRYFEIAHLFTQWGAAHAPKVMVTVDGNYRKLFGWETDALSSEYREFLHAFLPELIHFLREEGVFENCYFHISDEPFPPHLAYYESHKELLCRYIPQEQLIDALADYVFYEKGLIQRPVVSSDHLKFFTDQGVTNLWTYYCMGQRKDVANRFMALPSYRSRILGAQLYKNDIKGFLHWGYNFWFSADSQKVINPYMDTTADGHFQGGDSFLVYPLDEQGNVGLSIRLYVVNEAMQDLRALTLLEQLSSKEDVLQLLEDVIGMEQYPRNQEYVLKLRENINRSIELLLCKKQTIWA